MALIPGTLPNDTCYGTPQDLLELFAQYLDVPAFALNSKVVFATASTGLTADVVWFDTTTATNPIMKIFVSGGFTDYIKNYVTSAATVTIVGADSVLILDASDSGNTKKGLVSDIVSLVPSPTPPAGSITASMLNGAQTGTAPIYGVRAWVVFNSTGGIVSSGNIASVVLAAPSTFTVTFTTNMANANYSVVFGAQAPIVDLFVPNITSSTTNTVSSFQVITGSQGSGYVAAAKTYVQVISA